MTRRSNRQPRMIQATIAIVLLLLFGLLLLLPAFVPMFKVEADTKQTLFTLVTAVVFFFIGRNTDPGHAEAQVAAAQITAAQIASLHVGAERRHEERRGEERRGEERRRGDRRAVERRSVEAASVVGDLQTVTEAQALGDAGRSTPSSPPEHREQDEIMHVPNRRQ